MPRKLRIAKPRRQQEANPYVVALLRTGAWPSPDRDRSDLTDGHLAWECFRLTGPHSDEPLHRIWRELRDEILDEWIATQPGTRCHGWWTFDSPRWRLEDRPARCRDLGAWEGQLGEPRRRVGGIGTPCYEVLNVIPEFACGIPTSWVSAFDEQYYNGRARDIHGTPIGTEYHEGMFEGLAPRAEDPPRFESQASYLDRHGLLTPGERRVLTAIDFAPEILDLTADDESA